MLLITTIDQTLQIDLKQALVEKEENYLLLQEGENIVEAIFRHQPSTVILDLYLTHPTGLAILRQLRAEGYAGKVVALSGLSDQTLASEAVHLGALQVLGRPFDVDQILAAAGEPRTGPDDDPAHSKPISE